MKSDNIHVMFIVPSVDIPGDAGSLFAGMTKLLLSRDYI